MKTGISKLLIILCVFTSCGTSLPFHKSMLESKNYKYIDGKWSYDAQSHPNYKCAIQTTGYENDTIIIDTIIADTNSLCNYKIEDRKEKEIISINRGACYGTCPIYSFNIFSDMSAVYHGKNFVEKTGTIVFKLSEEEINSILQKANEINYCKMESEYTEMITDLPTTHIKIFDKKITDYYGAPKELKELEKLIDYICFKYIE